mmetsp:Transcript_13360/g.45154  ORF Transcript_13360/g.45154 Transcript_13360/m.45154 type:complete len:292 (+) Transcript_13360:358-1233(+)
MFKGEQGDAWMTQQTASPTPAPLRRLTMLAVAGAFRVLLGALNDVRVEDEDRERLLRYVQGEREGRGLLSVSNHCSVYDDPGLWSVVLPVPSIGPDDMRWSLCTHDVFFATPVLEKVLTAGNVVPLYRLGGLDQPLLRFFMEKLEAGGWCHVFPEGRIFQPWRFSTGEPKLGPLQLGVGKLIAHTGPSPPLVLPLYHRGMHNVAPEVIPAPGRREVRGQLQSRWPKLGNRIDLYVGEPVDVADLLQEWRTRHPDVDLTRWESCKEGRELYQLIVDRIRDAMLELEARAWAQ